MSFLRSIFELEANQIVLNFAHGLVFFLMGFGILIKSKRWSELTLAKSLPWLGLFGAANALGDWGQVFLPIQRPVFSDRILGVMWVFDTALLAGSYAILLYFGARLLADTEQRWSRLPRIVPFAYGAWFAALVASLVFGRLDPTGGPQAFVAFEIAYRYGFAFTGSIVSARALFSQREELRRLELDSPAHPLHWAGYAFILHGVASGLIVPEAAFFPANLLNNHVLFAVTGLPVRLFTGLSGAIVAALILVNLEVFDEELHRRIEEHRRVRAVLEERMRIARDLHDGIIQSLYALGLNLEGILFALDDAAEATRAEIRSVMNSLNGAIQEVRAYILRLKTPDQDASLDEQLRLLVRRIRSKVRVPVRLKSDSIADGLISSEAIHDVLLIVREAVSNATRHARASEIRISLVKDERGITLSIADDGIGFDPDAVSPGPMGERQGLENMRRRAEAIGGRFSIHSAPGEGTEVMLRLPLRSPSGEVRKDS